MTDEELKTGEEGLVEVLCFLCFPYICSWWDLPYKERIEKCKALKDSIYKIKQAGYVQLDDDQSLPEGVGLCMDCTDSDKMLKAGFKKVK